MKEPLAPYPPVTLSQYALLADGERGALISPHGEIVWMCAPTWDAPAVFAGLIGGNGHFTVTPSDEHVWGGYYEPGTLIWRSRWTTRHGFVECREALARPGDPHRAVLLRRLRALDHGARLELHVDPRADFGRAQARWWRTGPGVWEGATGDLRMRLSGVSGLTRRTRHPKPALCWDIQLPAGHARDLVLEISDGVLPDELPEPAALWADTESSWRPGDVGPDLGDADEAVRHSLAVLRGLTGSGGGMVAAATTSLPERAEAGRNYDYRFVWIRDQCFAGQAAAVVGAHDLLDAATTFVSARLLTDGSQLAPAYTGAGRRVPDQHVRHDLPGYPGGEVRLGNWVNQQFQLDAFGEALCLFAAAARQDRLDDVHRRAATAAVSAITQRWQEKDAGIWEIDNRAWTHSRLMAAAGLRSWAGVATDNAQLLALADAIMADTSSHALHASGRWQRSPDDPKPDAALLLPPLRGLPADDPRSQATLAAVLEELTELGHAYRFRHDHRPLHTAEGSFTLCGFLVAMSLADQARPVEAATWYQRSVQTWGPPRIYAEEYDVVQHQLRGNLPQAFVHAVHIEAAARLAQA